MMKTALFAVVACIITNAADAYTAYSVCDRFAANDCEAGHANFHQPVRA